MTIKYNKLKFDKDEFWQHYLGNQEEFIVYGFITDSTNKYVDYIFSGVDGSIIFTTEDIHDQFYVVDNRTSSYWKTYRYNDAICFLHQDWIKYFEKNKIIFPDEILFETYIHNDWCKKSIGEMNNEFDNFLDVTVPIETITARANSLEDDWVMCPDCYEVWEKHTNQKIIKCPKCLGIMTA